MYNWTWNRFCLTAHSTIKLTLFSMSKEEPSYSASSACSSLALNSTELIFIGCTEKKNSLSTAWGLLSWPFVDPRFAFYRPFIFKTMENQRCFLLWCQTFIVWLVRNLKWGVESSWSDGMYPHKNGTSVPRPQSRETCQISGFTQSNSKLPAGPPLAVS